MRVFHNRVLRIILWPKRDEVTRESGENYIMESFYDLYYSPNIVWVIKSRRMRWAGHVARMGEKRAVYRVLVAKPEGKRPAGRSRLRREDNIHEVGSGGMDWNELAQDRDTWRGLVNVVMKLRVP